MDTVDEQRCGFAAAIELRRRFLGIADNAQARECPQTIAGWRPLSRQWRRAMTIPECDAAVILAAVAGLGCMLQRHRFPAV